VVVDNFHMISIPVPPHEANSPLIIDPNTMLPFSVAMQCFQAVTGRRCQVAKLCGNVELSQFSLRGPLEALELLYVLSRVKLPSFL
jgi:hypothetical protein